MIEYLKKELLKNPEKMIMLLENFEFVNVKLHENKYVSFGIDKDHSSKSVVIYLDSNPYLFVTDYGRNKRLDLFSYIVYIREISFKRVLSIVRNLFDFNEIYLENKTFKPFGGFYQSLSSGLSTQLIPIDEKILDDYIQIPSKRFLDDGISLFIQKKFQISYDPLNRGIVIPLRNEVGELVGIKERINGEEDKRSNKYFFSHPCPISQLLFGYYENYEFLNSKTIFVFEAEKSVMQCRSFGIKNAVSIGSSSISKKQIELLLTMSPQKIVLAHDKSLDFGAVKSNAKKIYTFSRMLDLKVYWLDMENDTSIKDKASPSDMGGSKFKYICKNYLEKIEID